MIDVNEIKQLTKWIIEHPRWCWNYQEQFADPFMKAVGEDRKGLEEYLSKRDAGELCKISGVFEEIYKKWMDEDMWDFLDGLERKIKDAGYQPY